jgi:hypothetical protein
VGELAPERRALSPSVAALMTLLFLIEERKPFSLDGEVDSLGMIIAIEACWQ